jgi:hypothetical protein
LCVFPVFFMLEVWTTPQQGALKRGRPPAHSSLRRHTDPRQRRRVASNPSWVRRDLFDLETTRPETVFSLLETQPGLLLLGISPDGNVMRLWSGRELREVSGKELKEIIEEHLADARPS